MTAVLVLLKHQPFAFQLKIIDEPSCHYFMTEMYLLV